MANFHPITPLRAFPGIAPRLNVNHPAYRKLRLAMIPVGAGAINLVNGSAGTSVSNSNSIVNTVAGPGTPPVAENAFPVHITEAVTAGTWSAIFVYSTVASQKAMITAVASLATAVPNTAILIINGGVPTLTPALPTLVPGHAYFFGLVANTVAPRLSVVLHDLTTGQIFTATGTAAVSGTLTIGQNFLSPGLLGLRVNATSFSAAAITPQQLLQWAQDPWSLWYDRSALSVASMAVQARIIIPANITAALATTEAADFAHFRVSNEPVTGIAAQLAVTEAADVARFTVHNENPSPEPSPPVFVSGPTTQTKAIPSYPYKEYDDDPFTTPFFTAYNQVAQDYVDTVNALNLPIYTASNINGLLLDWVGGGIYGFARPTIASASTPGVGTLNTYQLNALTLNTMTRATPGIAQTASDDIYKRCLTWHIFKGEGRYFTIKSLKRRVMRFILGDNGSAPNIDQTYQISVSFGPNHEVTIRFINSLIKTLRSAQLNTFQLNTTTLNSSVNQITLLTPLPFQQIFQDAVLSGALDLPFQFSWEVVIT
jgi:hypothetical protein